MAHNFLIFDIGLSYQFLGVNLKATIANEYLNEGSSADALAGVKRQTKNSSVRPTEQLAYLASVLNFQIQFSDFPKVSD